MKWKGVMPAITTCFDENLQIDHEFTRKHVKWLVENGSTGIVTNGSLGEGATLTFEEKKALWKTCVEAIGDKVPVVAAIASLSTKDGIKQAQAAQETGCEGLMVLPPYVHKGDWREMKFHISEIIRSTSLSFSSFHLLLLSPPSIPSFLPLLPSPLSLSSSPSPRSFPSFLPLSSLTCTLLQQI